MVRKAVSNFLLIFFSIASLCLPMGNLTMMQNIPEMYSHCKSTEDKDMGPLDFITDHLLNIDALFDNHDKGDEQKPHKPIQLETHCQPFVFVISTIILSIEPFYPSLIKHNFQYENYYKLGFLSEVFRPPIA
jgi:hypothetical protein